MTYFFLPKKPLLGSSLVVAYLSTILAANYATDKFGAVSLLPGIVVVAGTLFVGAALLLRNAIQDALGRVPVLLAIAAGTALSCVVSPSLALASGTAFALSELADMGVYTPLRKRGWVKAVMPASFVGSVADSFVFLYLAGFPVSELFLGQVVGKYSVTVVCVLAVAAFGAIFQRRRTPLET